MNSELFLIQADSLKYYILYELFTSNYYHHGPKLLFHIVERKYIDLEDIKSFFFPF